MAKDWKGSAEEAVCRAMVRFERERMGRGPLEARAFLIDDMVVVRLRDVLTPVERSLAASSEPAAGRELVKNLRREVLEGGAPQLHEVVRSATGVPVRSMHADVSTRTGERVVVFTLERPPSDRDVAEAVSTAGVRQE